MKKCVLTLDMLYTLASICKVWCYTENKNFSLTDHFPALEGDITWDRKRPFENMFLEGSNSLGFEWHLCCNHEVQEHAKSPDIYRCPQVAFIPEQLRCCIWGWPTECIQLLSSTWARKQLFSTYVLICHNMVQYNIMIQYSELQKVAVYHSLSCDRNQNNLCFFLVGIWQVYSKGIIMYRKNFSGMKLTALVMLQFWWQILSIFSILLQFRVHNM